FSLLSPLSSLTVPVTSLSANDNVAVTGYLLSENPVTPKPDDAKWSETAPSRYTFSSEGIKTLFAWAKDAAGNVSESVSAKVAVSSLSNLAVNGNSEVFNLRTTTANRRSQPVTFNESGE